ncbi:MAG: hypothetical protein LWX54_03040 [Deltaproteobacteria bacterium]|jgi:hypothetical protein|nr:hypothetical protein [Deltaproteobacteria bacterium]
MIKILVYNEVAILVVLAIIFNFLLVYYFMKKEAYTPCPPSPPAAACSNYCFKRDDKWYLVNPNNEFDSTITTSYNTATDCLKKDGDPYCVIGGGGYIDVNYKCVLGGLHSEVSKHCVPTGEYPDGKTIFGSTYNADGSIDTPGYTACLNKCNNLQFYCKGGQCTGPVDISTLPTKPKYIYNSMADCLASSDCKPLIYCCPNGKPFDTDIIKLQPGQTCTDVTPQGYTYTKCASYDPDSKTCKNGDGNDMCQPYYQCEQGQCVKYRVSPPKGAKGPGSSIQKTCEDECQQQLCCPNGGVDTLTGKPYTTLLKADDAGVCPTGLKDVFGKSVNVYPCPSIKSGYCYDAKGVTALCGSNYVCSPKGDCLNYVGDQGTNPSSRDLCLKAGCSPNVYITQNMVTTLTTDPRTNIKSCTAVARADMNTYKAPDYTTYPTLAACQAGDKPDSSGKLKYGYSCNPINNKKTVIALGYGEPVNLVNAFNCKQPSKDTYACQNWGASDQNPPILPTGKVQCLGNSQSGQPPFAGGDPPICKGKPIPATASKTCWSNDSFYSSNI